MKSPMSGSRASSPPDTNDKRNRLHEVKFTDRNDGVASGADDPVTTSSSTYEGFAEVKNQFPFARETKSENPHQANQERYL